MNHNEEPAWRSLRGRITGRRVTIDLVLENGSRVTGEGESVERALHDMIAKVQLPEPRQVPE